MYVLQNNIPGFMCITHGPKNVLGMAKPKMTRDSIHIKATYSARTSLLGFKVPIITFKTFEGSIMFTLSL